MIRYLGSLAKTKLILGFAPSTPSLYWLKKVGEFFPSASKASRAYLHSETVIKICLPVPTFLSRDRK
jgi:magnesium-protoporphyrin O-methyltransferase